MKKLVTILVILLIAAGAFSAYNWRQGVMAEAERISIVRSEKQSEHRLYCDFLIFSLEKAIKDFEENVGVSLAKVRKLESESLPDVLRHRLNRNDPSEYADIELRSSYALIEVLFIEACMGKVEGKLTESEASLRLNAQFSKGDELWKVATTRRDNRIATSKAFHSKYVNLTWNTIPPERLDVLRSEGKIKYN